MNSKRPKRLTDASIRKMTLPKGSQEEIPDGLVPGLRLRITSHGTKSWCYLYRFAKKNRRMTLGRFPHISLKEARENARQAAKKINKGLDPSREKNLRQRDRELEYHATFGILCEKFMREYERGVAHYETPDTAKPLHRTWKETEQVLKNKVLPSLGHLPLTDIKRCDILSILEPIKLIAPYQANKTFAIVRKIYNWALSMNHVETSPCFGIKKPHKAIPRNRPLRDKEICSLWDACVEIGYPFGDAFRLMLITGQRRTEVAAMTYDELDLKNSEWILSPDRTKAARRHVVPLGPLALEVLRGIPNTGGKFVFSTCFGETPISGYTKPTREVMGLAGLDDVCLKDMRETVGTMMRQRLKVTTDVIGQVLNHAPQGVTQRHYASMASVEDIREALMKWDNYIRDLVFDNVDTLEADNIIRFPDAG